MQKEIKKIIEDKLYCKNNTTDWATMINDYYERVKATAKGVVLKWRYFEKRDIWRCLRELNKVKVYCEKDNFYKLVNSVINDISVRACFKGLINPYEFEL